MTRTVSEISQLVAQGMAALDVAPMADVFAADAVYELPFLGHRVEGRAAILAALAAGASGPAPSAWRKYRSPPATAPTASSSNSSPKAGTRTPARITASRPRSGC